MNLAALMICGVATVQGNTIDITHLLQLRLILDEAIAYCTEHPCTPGIMEDLQTVEACESQYVEQLLGVERPVTLEVFQEGDRFFIRRDNFFLRMVEFGS